MDQDLLDVLGLPGVMPSEGLKYVVGRSAGHGSTQQDRARCVNLLRRLPQLTQVRFRTLPVHTHAVLLPEGGARLEDHARVRVVRDAADGVALGLRPVWGDGNLPEHHRRHRADQVIGILMGLAAELAILHPHAGLSAFDAGYGASQVDALA